MDSIEESLRKFSLSLNEHDWDTVQMALKHHIKALLVEGPNACETRWRIAGILRKLDNFHRPASMRTPTDDLL